jgi:crotonobetaine/carnitine-CoA ligase
MLTPLQVLKHYPAHDATLCGAYESRMTVTRDQPFILFQGKSWSRAEFRDAYLATARVLVARGIKKGDRVGVMARNHVGHVLMLFACARIGAIMVPTNPEFGVGEVSYVLKHAGVSAMACGADLLPVVREACRDITPVPFFMLFDGATADVPSLFDLIAAAPDVALPPPASASDTCIIIYTSGSTGFPKGAMHSQSNFVASGEANVARLWLQPEERMLVVLPLFHVNALFYSLAGALAAGATLIIVERFSASTFWDTAVETGATQVNTIDAVGRILTARPRSEFRPEHKIRVAYGVRPEAQGCFRDEFGIKNLITGFGMTEIPGLICSPYVGKQKLTSLGPVGQHPDPARPWAQCRLVDDNGKDVAIGETGELWVKHPIVMQGYFRDPEQTQSSFEDGWFKTGDLMTRDADDYYYFVTRKKDIIRRRGENIAGLEIDRTISAHPDVVEVAAVPVPAELGEDEILVAVVKKPGATLDARGVAQWCAERLAAMKVPRYVLFVDALPHTPTHKIAKHVLKADKTLQSRATDLSIKTNT